MKQFIVLCAVFILLVAIFLQIPIEMVNYERRHAIMFYVNNAKEIAKQEGYYTDEILDSLKDNISKHMDIAKTEVYIGEETTRTPKYRQEKSDDIINGNEVIRLVISVPFSKIIAVSDFFDIENDKRYYKIDIVTTSERLRNKQ